MPLPCIQNTAVYLSGAQLLALMNAGAVTAVAGKSDMPQYHNHVTSVYFFNADGLEVAHLTMLSESPQFYKRKWGSLGGYTPLVMFERMVADRESLSLDINYNLVI